jgi:hypothetical protein
VALAKTSKLDEKQTVNLRIEPFVFSSPSFEIEF